MDQLGSLLSFISSLIVAVITANLTVRLALKRFYAEKWWERKATAYNSIIEALHHVREHADTNLHFSLTQRDLPEKSDQELTDKLETAMAELRKQLDVGDFLLSDEAVAAMNKLMNGLDKSTRTTCWQEHLQLKVDAVDSCLAEMRLMARKDLKLIK
jgi:hypothetical protein